MIDFWTPSKVFTASIILRLSLLLYGLVQDAFSPLKYTDIDYLVFTDAARYVSHGHSPYRRETYRYTPLLAWLLLPTSGWFSFGKVMFGVADVVAGWLLILVLRSPAGGGMETRRAVRFASIWLLNPMVATISTRGSSEGLLGVIVVALVWAVTQGRIKLAGVLLGFGVHFKIYPFIYAPSLFLYLGGAPSIRYILNRSQISLVLTSFVTFMSLNVSMYGLYGFAFLQHTYFHHVVRIDHRHNFSPYNTLLYASASDSAGPVKHESIAFLQLESLAFLPQLGVSAVLLPLVLTKHHLPGTMLAQTWAFVALNKVCTSQVSLQPL